MENQVRNLIAKWDATWPSPLVVSRQHDNGQFRINLVDYPEPENYEDQNEEILETINYYLVVWMKQSEDGEMEKLAPIQLPGPYWLVNSPYTQLVQDIKFQFYATSSVTGYIAHSAQFKGMILESLSGSQQQSVIPEEMWDAYKQYIEDKIIGAGLATIDPTLSISGAAADAKAAGDAIAGVNGRLQQVEGLTGVSVEGQISATTEGRAINPATGGTNAAAALAYYTIPCNGGETLTVTMPIFTSSRNLGIAFYTSIDGSYASAYISGTKAKYNTSLFEMSYETKTLQVPDNARVIRTTWFATGSTHADAFSCVLEKPGTFPTEFKQIQSDLVTVSENRLDPSTILVGKYINVSGSQGTSDAYAVTDYIKVKEGETLYARFGTNSALPLRYVAAYDSGKAVLSAKGTENASSYTVPEGVVYVRISANANYLPSPTTRISTSPECEKYQPYLSAKVADFSAKAMTCAKNTLMYPLSTLPPYILGALAYRPLGVLSQGYVCFVSDDGRKELATYSIPMFISKGVPLTMAVMSDSEVFTDAENASTYTATVVDAVQNHGFEIAQHGGTRWDEYSEYGLNRFFENESAFFANLGLTAYGAACPAHNINDLVRVVAGGRFGCVRTGYDNGVPRYTNYMSGPKSNIFGLSSQSAVDGTLSTQCAALDMAKENHWLRVIHYHEFDLDTSAKMEQLEGIIDYAKEIGLTFITMKDIPTII